MQETYSIKTLDLADKATSIQEIANSYDLTMRGYSINLAESRWEITGQAMMTEEYIRATTSILQSFCNQANLITTKDEDKFFRAYADAFHRVNALLLNNKTRNGDMYNVSIKLFKDHMESIGDILVGSRNLMENVYKSYDSSSNQHGEY